MEIDSESVKSQILDFCNENITENDIVVGALRYGAHLPHIYQSACLEHSTIPKKINLILSHMLTFFPKKFFEGKKIIILDDTIYRGNEMKRLSNILINTLGIEEENIRTAALVIHEQSDYLPSIPGKTIQYSDPEYIAWKEVLASIIADDTRPTDRDHPLYYFETQNITPGQFIDIIENYGTVHSTGRIDSQVFKFSLSFDTTPLKDSLEIPGIDFGSMYKLRFYWKKESIDSNLTIVPMGFPIVDVEEFISKKGGPILARLLGLNESYFDDIYEEQAENSRGPMLYYFISRGISLLVLESFLKKITHSCKSFNCNLLIKRSEDIDKKVNYIFPGEYKIFYEIALKTINNILQGSLPVGNIFPDQWMTTNILSITDHKDIYSHSIYEIIGYLTKDRDSAKWDGDRWIPDVDALNRGVPLKELIAEFQDPQFLSRALDELLESGLIRARDMQLIADPKKYTRHFLPGGEYNAIHMSRISDSLRYKLTISINPTILEEEAIELWGPD